MAHKDRLGVSRLDQTLILKLANGGAPGRRWRTLRPARQTYLMTEARIIATLGTIPACQAPERVQTCAGSEHRNSLTFQILQCQQATIAWSSTCRLRPEDEAYT